MQSVIGIYQSFGEAQRAVRILERHQLSIQDVVISDQTRRIGRPSKLSSDQQDRMKGQRSDFLVIMTGEAGNIARATELLRRPPAA
jgi:hypothetical protein